ncbi:MAG: ABC transporter permease [Eubacteriales bacterium]|nr:ABC transporter permease [Eubacteriales bacterium]
MDMQDNRPSLEEQPFVPAGEPLALDDERRLKVLSPGMLVFKRFVRNRLAITGAFIILFMFLFSFLGGVVTPYTESKVFKDYELMNKLYAVATENNEFRYILAENQTFDSTAKSKMILAILKNESTFESGGSVYGLEKEGKDFYRVTGTSLFASGKGIKNQFKLQPADGIVLPDDFMAKFNEALAAGETSFTTNDGQSFLLKASKVEAEVYKQEDLALASKLIFTGDLDENYAFRLAAEQAIQGGQDAKFSVGEQTYTLLLSEDGVAIFTDKDGMVISQASHFLMKASQVGTVFPEGFAAAVQAAITGKQTSFVLQDETGEDRLYLLEHGTNEYVIRTELETYQINMYSPPSWEHPLGTDGNGMDVLTRLMYGGRVSLLIGFVVVLLETILGVVLGGIAGYFGKWVDNLLMRLVDIFNCIPGLPLFIIIGAIMDAEKVKPTYRIFVLMIAMGVLGWPGIARVVRGQILSLREQEFMTAAEATGISVKRRIFRHLVPNVIPQLVVIATMTLGDVILTEATLSFLGLGVKYPLASWGSIINAVSNIYVMTNYWYVWIPAGFLILLTVLGFNFIGDGLRDAFDPKMKR